MDPLGFGSEKRIQSIGETKPEMAVTVVREKHGGAVLHGSEHRGSSQSRRGIVLSGFSFFLFGKKEKIRDLFPFYFFREELRKLVKRKMESEKEW